MNDNKNDEAGKPSLSENTDEAVEARVRQIMDPSSKEPNAAKTPEQLEKEITESAQAAVAKTAPELPNSPMTDKPEPITDKQPEQTFTQEAEKSPETKTEADTTDNPEIDKAVDDIVASEGDQLLEAEDEKIAKAFDEKKPSFKQRIKNALSAWWNNPVARRTTIAGLLVAIIIILAVPPSRYFVLNNVGVRSGASLIVLDESTQQPLKNVTVRLSGQSAVTDNEGKVRLSHLKLGKNELVIEKRAFAANKKIITLGWGSNPLGNFSLSPVGVQYAFVVTDFLSGKPVEKVEAIQGEFSAFSDEKGKIKLTVEDTTVNEVTVVIKAEGYRDETRTFSADLKDEQAIQLVPGRKHVFISKRSGKFDVYKIDVDGKNEEKILAGTGSERDDMVLAPHPTDEIVALVSTRENMRNKDGFLLSTLTLIDLSNNATTKVTQSERIQVVDWFGDRLVYVEIAAGASGNSPKRHRLNSFDYKTEKQTELASSNYFNDVLNAGGFVYYASSSAYQTSPVNFYRVQADGTNRQTVLDKEVWNVFRTDYDKLTIAVEQSWYEHSISNNKNSVLGGEPANLVSRTYIDSPDNKNSLWVDQRDGKGVLLNYELQSKAEKELKAQSGLNNPIRWLNNSSVVFRIKTEQETADYAMSLDGGEPKKIKNVTNTAGIDQWYYY